MQPTKGKLKFETGHKDEETTKAPAVEDRGIVEKVDDVMAQALATGATDIHVDPDPQETRVRIRVDGALQELATFNAAKDSWNAQRS